MIARRLRPASLGAPLAALVAFALSVAACDKVPLTAPTESTISLFATASSISATGSTDIVATVIESAGTPVQNGTVVTFTTTLGRIEPLDARTQNGKVTVKLTGDGARAPRQSPRFPAAPSASSSSCRLARPRPRR